MLQEHSQRTLMSKKTKTKKNPEQKKMYKQWDARQHKWSPSIISAGLPGLDPFLCHDLCLCHAHVQPLSTWLNITIKHLIKRVTILTNLIGSMKQNKLDINQRKEGPDAF